MSSTPNASALRSALRTLNTNWDEWDVLRRLRATPQILERLSSASGSELQVQAVLRREFPDTLVRAALNLVELRHKAQAKFALAHEMWFDRTGLEQATPELVARHKSRRFSGLVWDYCCGIGADALALSESCEVVAVDVNPLKCLLANWNSRVGRQHPSLACVCADVEQLPIESGLLHFDPDRRPTKNARVVRIEDYVPGLEFMTRCTREFRGGGAIKLSPAANFPGKFPNAEIELISLYGECKEATVWFGELARPEPWRATVLPSGDTLAGDPLDALAEVRPLGAYLYDPDPAVVRAGLVDLLAELLGLSRLDEKEEYLTGDSLVSSPFVRGFATIAELPNNPRVIRKFFRESRFGQLEIKCRHIPIDVEAVRRQIPLSGTEPAVLIFARLAGKAHGVVCRRLSAT